MHPSHGPGCATPSAAGAPKQQQPVVARTGRAVTPSKRKDYIDLDEYDDQGRHIGSGGGGNSGGGGVAQQQQASSKRARPNSSSSSTGASSAAPAHQNKSLGHGPRPAGSTGSSGSSSGSGAHATSAAKTVTATMASMSMSAVQKGKRPETSAASPAMRGGPVQPRSVVVAGVPGIRGFNPQAGARKLVIKNMRSTPSQPQHQHQQQQQQQPRAVPSATTASTTIYPSTSSAAPPQIPPSLVAGVSDSVASYYSRTWEELESGLAAVLAGRNPDVSCDRLYRGVEDLCRWGKARELYGLLSKKCDGHVSGELRAALDREIGTVGGGGGGGESRRDGSSSKDVVGAYDVPVVRAVLARWKRWNEQTRIIRSIFSYLDRSYLLTQKDCPEINELAINLFRNMLFRRQHAKPSEPEDPDKSDKYTPGHRLLHGVCELVDHDRRGDERFDSTLLRNAISMLHVLGVYLKRFEPRLLKESHAFFEEFGEARSSSSLRDYISACKRLIEREDFRCIEYNLDSTTKRQIRDDAHEVLVMRYAERLLHAGDVARLLDEGSVESMKALYELLRLPGIQARLKGPWEEYIKASGAAIVNDAERGDEMVVRLLVLRKTLDNVVRDAFGKDAPAFTISLRNAFGSFINAKASGSSLSSWGTGTSRVGEMIAKHIDMLLRGGLKTLPASLLSDDRDKRAAEERGIASTGDDDAELDRQLDHAVELFRFIEGRDVFEAFYKRDLARRLLMGRSANHDAERKILTKFQNECGSSFTHNFEQMFKDQDIARDEMASYKQWLEGTSTDGRKGGLDLQVSILSASAWPTYPDARVNLPPDVAREIEKFEQYYQKKHTGRILTWKHALAHCVVKGQFDRGAKELVMSAFQAIVLVLFNEVEAARSVKKQSEEPTGGTPGGFLSYAEIKEVTSLSDPDLQRTLQSLACGRARVLTKHPKGRDVAVTDTFTVNRAFADPKYRIKINQIQLQETKEENRQTHERVAQDRLFETQAAIVRVMKSRKTMTHVALVTEVINQTRKRGAVEPAEIKLNIEKLIEKDYLEREGSSYTYLA